MEWVTYPFSSRSSPPRDWTSWFLMSPALAGRFFTTSTTWESGSESRSVVSESLLSHGLYSSWNSPGQNTWVGSLSHLQGIFPTQELNSGLLHYRRIPYQLSHKGSPRILEWVAYPFSSRSSQPRNPTGVSFIAGGFFTNWAIREAPGKLLLMCYCVLVGLSWWLR